MAQGFATNGNIVISGGVDSSNSTTTPLNAGATFTGAWVDASSYPSMTIAVKTDQNGIYTVQFSPDGTNADSTLTRYYTTTQIEPPHSFVITRKYMRVTFTNTSASNQTYLRLQVLLGSQGQLNAPLDSTLSQDFDANVTRPSDYNDEVILGRRQGAVAWNKFGYNDDVDTGTEVVWSVGGLHTIMTTARTLSVVSTSVQDDTGGTGATFVIIYGINANRLSQTEVLALNGTTPVITVNTWLGVNRMAVYLCGSSISNVGTITATATTDLTVQAQIPILVGTTQQCIFYTQDSHQALIKYISLSAARATSGTNPKIVFKMWVYSFVSQSKYEVFRKEINTDVTSELDASFPIPLQVGEKSVIWIEATTDQNNTSVTARFSLIEVRDVDA